MTTPAALSRPARTRAPRPPGSLYRPLTGLVLRAPLLPAAGYGPLGTAVGGGSRGWADPAFRFAVSVASPDLAAAWPAPVDSAAAGAASPGQPSPRARAALQRYLIRACLRPTPFGGFAAVAVAHWADTTSAAIAPGDWPTRTRPDMAWLTAVAQRLADHPQVRPWLRVFTNACAFERAGRVYLADRSTGGAGEGPDVSVRATPMVRRVLDRARDGAGLAELRRCLLAAAPRTAPSRADAFLAELCDHQLLVPELLPTLTGDPLAHLAGQLALVPAPVTAAAGAAGVDVAAELSGIGAACAELDAAGPAAKTARLTAIRERLSRLGAGLGIEPRAEPGGLLQVDTALPLLSAGLSRQVGADVAAAADILLRLHPSPSADRLAAYRAEFHRRYGDDRRVPVLELLDPRFGLGPPGRHPAPPPDAGPGARRPAALMQLLATSIRAGFGEVTLDPDLIERLSTWQPEHRRLAASLELSVFVAARSAAAVDRGDYLLVVGPNLGAAAAGRGLGRFAGLLGAPARALLQEAADAEDAGPALVAELVYRPVRARSANVAIRPLVRAFEIPVGVTPSLAPDAVIRVDELSVILRDGRLRVWWERAACEVSLAAGHMLNAAAAPPLCRQLAELAADGVTGPAPFDFGPLSAMPFLPRVRAGRVVLHPARWRLARPAGRDPGGPDGRARFDAELTHWRAQWQVPRHVYLTRADHRLLLDLDDAGHRDQLRAALARPGPAAAVLQEGLPGPADAWLPGPRGNHVVELVVPLVRSQPPGRPVSPGPGRGGRTAAAAAAMPLWPDADRRRPPGSDWLYLTLSGPRAAEDGLLAGSLGALAERLVEDGAARGWFFVRYGDPEPQLRLRLTGVPAVLIERALPALTAWGAQAIAAGSRTRLALETYERELERYGGPVTTGLCEQIACADSRAVRLLLAAAAALPPVPDGPDPDAAGTRGTAQDGAAAAGPAPGRLAHGGNGPNGTAPKGTAPDGTAPDGTAVPRDRIELALVSTADLLASLPGEPAALIPPGPDAAGISARSGAVYRERQVHLRALVAAAQAGPADVLADGPRPASPPPPPAPWPQVRDVLADRRARLAPLAAQLREACRDGTGRRPAKELTPSLIHLHANRLGLSRADEGLMLGLLDRTLRSIRAYPVPAGPQASQGGAQWPG